MSERTNRQSKVDYDVVVAGAGAAGCAAARGLSKEGYKVAHVDPSSTAPEKSLFVNGQWIDPKLLEYLQKKGALVHTPSIEVVNVDNPALNWGNDSGQTMTYGVLHLPIISYLKDGTSGNVEVFEHSVQGSTERTSCVETSLSDGTSLTSIFLIDASGDGSFVSRNHKVEGEGNLLDDNPLVLWIRGIRIHGTFPKGIMYEPIGRELGLPWVFAYDDNYVDVVAADFCRLSKLNPDHQEKLLGNLIAHCMEEDLLEIKNVEEPLVGIVRCEPIRRSDVKKSQRVYSVGGAAGMASPLMAELLPAALLWGDRVAGAIADGQTPVQFHETWRKQEAMFPYDLELAMLKMRVANEARGKYGTNARVYQSILELLPEDAQEQVLKDRKIPKRYWPMLLPAIAQNPSLVPYLVSLGVKLARVKLGKR